MDRATAQWVTVDATISSRKLVLGKKSYPLDESSEVLPIDTIEELADVWLGLPLPKRFPTTW